MVVSFYYNFEAQSPQADRFVENMAEKLMDVKININNISMLSLHNYNFY